jgi:hypothetical protein
MSRLSEAGAKLLGETLQRLSDLTPLAQDDAAATFAPILKKEDGLIDWTMSAKANRAASQGVPTMAQRLHQFQFKGTDDLACRSGRIRTIGSPGRSCRVEWRCFVSGVRRFIYFTSARVAV